MYTYTPVRVYVYTFVYVRIICFFPHIHIFLAGAEAGGPALLRRDARARAPLGARAAPLPDAHVRVRVYTSACVRIYAYVYCDVYFFPPHIRIFNAGAEAGGPALLRRDARTRAPLGARAAPLPDGASHPGLET